MLCNINNVLLGDVEKELGKTPGFFSRRCIVSADFMVRLAERFNISIDDLINGDFDEIYNYKVLSDCIKNLSPRMTKDFMVKSVTATINDVYGGNE